MRCSVFQRLFVLSKHEMVSGRERLCLEYREVLARLTTAKSEDPAWEQRPQHPLVL